MRGATNRHRCELARFLTPSASCSVKISLTLPAPEMLTPPPLLALHDVTVVRGELRGAAGAGQCIASHRGRGTRLYPRPQWLRQIHFDQNDHARVLSRGSRRFFDFHSGSRTMEYIRVALAAGDCLAGFAGFLHHGRHWARRRPLRIFQQHADFSAPSSRPRTSGARGSHSRAAWGLHISRIAPFRRCPPAKPSGR